MLKISLLKLTFSSMCAIMLRAVILCDCRELLASRKSSSREYPGTCIKIKVKSEIKTTDISYQNNPSLKNKIY